MQTRTAIGPPRQTKRFRKLAITLLLCPFIGGGGVRAGALRVRSVSSAVRGARCPVARARPPGVASLAPPRQLRGRCDGRAVALSRIRARPRGPLADSALRDRDRRPRYLPAPPATARAELDVVRDSAVVPAARHRVRPPPLRFADGRRRGGARAARAPGCRTARPRDEAFHSWPHGRAPRRRPPDPSRPFPSSGAAVIVTSRRCSSRATITSARGRAR